MRGQKNSTYYGGVTNMTYSSHHTVDHRSFSILVTFFHYFLTSLDTRLIREPDNLPAGEALVPK